MTPTITICSDAGHKNYFHKGIGTWACYIRTPTKTIKQSGVIKQSVKGSTHAEQYGIANALFLADKAEDLSQYRLIIYCDNKFALRDDWKITHTPKSKYYAKQVEQKEFFDTYIKPYLDKASSYEMRHVKGHQEQENWATGARNFMNDWCDTEAKRLMKLALRARWEEVKSEREEASQAGL